MTDSDKIFALEQRISELEFELKRKDVHLNEQHERFQVLTENMREGLILIGVSGNDNSSSYSRNGEDNA